MAGEKVNFEQAKAEAAAGPDAAVRRQSTILFPNIDLGAAADVAKAVYSRHGLSACPLDELAAEMGVTMSGNFRLRTSAARMFGFIEKDGLSNVKLTDLGSRLITQESEADAKAAAFLNVPLYGRIYENYKGKMLPPAKALEREMISLGVVDNQADRARQVFHRSATQAGFFNSGEGRLVRPKMSQTLENVEAPSPPDVPPVPAQQQRPSQSKYGGGGGGDDLHPFIVGLLQTLPEPGTVWAIEGRAAWLEAAAMNFKLIYQGDGKITVKADADKPNGASH